jgi:hypothetical protein
MPLLLARRTTNSILAASCVAALTGALVPLRVMAQPVTIQGQTISIGFVEKQTRVTAPALPAHQKNTVTLTFRTLQEIEFERERNPQTISSARTYKLATGLVGTWLPITNAAKVRVTGSARDIVIEQHIFNFMQRYEIITDGRTCMAKISYALDPGQLQFELRAIRTKEPLKLVSLAADGITCSLGNAAIY